MITFRTPYIFLFTSPWCFGCQSAKRSFTLLEQEFRKYGYGTGRINANIQPKLTQFMHVKVVPSLVVIYEEMIHHIPTQDVINGNFRGTILDFPASLSFISFQEYVMSVKNSFRIRMFKLFRI